MPQSDAPALPGAVVRWVDLPALDGVALLLDQSPQSLLEESRAFPNGIYGVASSDGATVMAVAVAVEREVASASTMSIVRLVARSPEPGADGRRHPADPILDWLEARARELEARNLGVTVRKAPAVDEILSARGYVRKDAYLTMRREASPRAVPCLPRGISDVALEDVGVDAFLAMSNRAFAGVPGSFPLQAEDWEYIRREPGFRPGLVRILTDGSEPVGFLRGGMRTADVGEVEAIGLVPGLRSKGLGRYLLRRCEHLLEELGARRVELLVEASNQIAVRLYRGEGYVEISRRESWARAV